jgi:glycosyltransferase involved in cell wall biosynthesis
MIWRHADALIGVSHAVKEWLVQKRRLSGSRISVIHYGIETTGFAAPATDLRKTRGMNGRVVIGAIGSLRPVKGFDCLIQAMPLVREVVPEASLIIAGHDLEGYRATLQGLIDEIRLAGQVQLVGFQSDVASFLHGVDVFAFPSRSEGFGQAVIEAMAAGKPVVASRIPPLTGIVVEGETGLLVEADNTHGFAEAIAWLLTHPEDARRMGRRGQERVQDYFSAERMSAETLELYEAVISRRRRNEKGHIRADEPTGINLK